MWHKERIPASTKHTPESKRLPIKLENNLQAQLHVECFARSDTWRAVPIAELPAVIATPPPLVVPGGARFTRLKRLNISRRVCALAGKAKRVPKETRRAIAS